MASLSRRLYVGSTSGLLTRAWQHKHDTFRGFTIRHRIDRLVYFEEAGSAYLAVTRERELKRWKRERKERLIATCNAGWRDLCADWLR